MTGVEATLLAALVSALVSIIVSGAGLVIQSQRFRRERKDQLREQMRLLVALFDRGVFYAGLEREDPVEMLWAINDIRTQLQAQGAALVRDRIAADAFSEIKNALYDMEKRVGTRFPTVAQLARQKGAEYVDRSSVQEELGGDYWAAMELMMELRPTVEEPINRLRQRLEELS